MQAIDGSPHHGEIVLIKDRARDGKTVMFVCRKIDH